MVESVSARSALISWSSPAADSLNGAGAHFRVHMSAGSLNRNRRDSEETEMYTEAQHAMLTNLSPNSLYTVTVEPANSEGMGPSSQLDVSTMEDGKHCGHMTHDITYVTWGSRMGSKFEICSFFPS